MDKENQRSTMSELDSAQIDLRSAGGIPIGGPSCSVVFNDNAAALVERTSSPMSSMLMSFSNQLQFGSATSAAKRSLDPVLARSQAASPLPSPFDDVEIFTKQHTVEQPLLKSRPFGIKEKSRSCSDVGQLLMQESLDFSALNYESSPFSPRYEEAASPAQQHSAKSRSNSSPTQAPLAASTTLPPDFELTLPIIKGTYSDTNTISCETVRATFR